MRAGRLSEDTVHLLHSLQRPLILTPDGLEPTELCVFNVSSVGCLDSFLRLVGLALYPISRRPRVEEVNQINSERLARLSGRCMEYQARDRPTTHATLRECNVEEIVRLKVGALVMYAKNSTDALLVNGSRGQVVAFVHVEDPALHKVWRAPGGIGLFPLVRFEVPGHGQYIEKVVLPVPFVVGKTAKNGDVVREQVCTHWWCGCRRASYMQSMESAID
ncbi:hypothetical protein CALCODRAFT_261353 [Calocera cornea HHB12733]|uniref:DNA helicase n=1 Tax=Calocera cornea HHB12733 TaxID=1353952 RepID=A0A166LC22_9BASI|nr:hypothetical protein CALCODRAFT_261353 [Calocera cornea HHB12733]